MAWVLILYCGGTASFRVGVRADERATNGRAVYDRRL